MAASKPRPSLRSGTCHPPTRPFPLSRRSESSHHGSSCWLFHADHSSSMAGCVGRGGGHRPGNPHADSGHGPGHRPGGAAQRADSPGAGRLRQSRGGLELAANVPLARLPGGGRLRRRHVHFDNGRKSVDGNYAKIFGKDYKLATYGDFRELVRRKEMDAVANCTPDHWHVLPALMAKCGKDMMCEKPLTLFVHEGACFRHGEAAWARPDFLGEPLHRRLFRIVELCAGA